MALKKYILCLSYQETDPADAADPELLKKARDKPKDMSDEDWSVLLTSIQYQVREAAKKIILVVPEG